jgi:membrane associated rhomboid family serine protease
VTYLLIGLSAVLYAYFKISGAGLRLPGGFPGLPSGSGFGVVPGAAILASPFLHAGLVPLIAGALFLFVLGDNVEDRIGRVPFLILYLLCGAAAGVAQLHLGMPGHPAALGSAGAVAGVLGAYLVFFPQVSITMYGLGRVASLPAYLFACAWVVAAFLIGPGPFTNFLNPAPFSLAGNLAGFGAGVFCAAFWRLLEEAVVRPRR